MKSKKTKRLKTGIVISDKMDKTIVVQVERTTTHTKYNKVIRTGMRFKAHDEKNEAKQGDKVRIRETRPLSKDKRWRIVEIVK